MENITIENLYDLKETIAADLFTEAEYPWEVLPRIHDFILELGKRLPEELYEKREMCIRDRYGYQCRSSERRYRI